MRVPRRYIDSFTRQLKAISADMRERLGDELEKISLDDVSTARNAIIDVMQAFCGTYTDVAATLGAEFYGGLREMAFGKGTNTVVESGWEPEAEDGAVRALIQDIVDGKPAREFYGKLLDRADSEIRKAANTCVARNAEHDKKRVRYARVPSGTETCEWCIMLASQGAVYKNESVASHSHANCECCIVPDFGDGISGYDPKYYYDVWKHPEEHPEYREARNARARELYAEKKSERDAESAITNAVQNDESTMFSSIFDYESETEKRVAAPLDFMDRIFKEIEDIGGVVQIADEQWMAYLEKKNAWAATIGDVAIFRPDATRSELVEEKIHVRQNKDMLNAELGHVERFFVNEYLAQIELIKNAEMYGFTSDEVDLTMRNRDIYLDNVIKMGLERYAENS